MAMIALGDNTPINRSRYGSYHLLRQRRLHCPQLSPDEALERNPLMKHILFAILIVLASTIDTMGQEWSQWRGEDRQGVWHEDGIIDRFSR